MKKNLKSALMVAIAIASTGMFTGCSSDDVVVNNLVFDESGNAGVESEFVISVPRTVVGTRMSNDVTQSAGTVAQFRGIDNIRMIPFATEPAAGSTKLSDIMRLSHVNSLSSPGAVNYKVYENQFVPVGTKNFLFYGKAIDNEADVAISTMDDKFKYGYLVANGLTDETFTSTNSISFGLEQINTNVAIQTEDTKGTAIIQLLNQLANTTVSGTAAPNDAWKTTNNRLLAALYKQFTSITTQSSNTLAVILSKLYFSLKFVESTDPAHDLAEAIKAKVLAACDGEPIEGSPATLKSQYAGFPANVGLPDGAVRIYWQSTGLNPNSFTTQTAHYGQGYNVDVTEYVYPAALWYYVNTPIKAANEKKSDRYESAGNWDGVINAVYNGADETVGSNTQSVALNKQAEYAVGRLETRVKMGDGDFYDANGEKVAYGTGFTLKGILLGGQNSVGFDFHPTGSENRTIYDRNMSSNTLTATPGTTTAANQTLALETASNQVVYAALELVNGGKDFQGADGLIPAGGTFYLAVKLDPTTASNYAAGTLDKIMQQDYVTNLTVTIKNGSQTVDRDGDGNPDVYLKDGEGKPTGVDTNGDGTADNYDIDGDGNDDTFVTDPANGGPGWDTDGDGKVDIPVVPNTNGDYPDNPTVPEGLGNATNGIPDLTSPGVELGTSVNLEWKQGLILEPSI